MHTRRHGPLPTNRRDTHYTLDEGAPPWGVGSLDDRGARVSWGGSKWANTGVLNPSTPPSLLSLLAKRLTGRGARHPRRLRPRPCHTGTPRRPWQEHFPHRRAGLVPRWRRRLGRGPRGRRPRLRPRLRFLARPDWRTRCRPLLSPLRPVMS
jgi:hypothetical protein